MALSNNQKAQLTEFSNTQPGLKPRGQIGHGDTDLDLGSMLPSGKHLDDVYRDIVVQLPFTVAAPAGSAATVDLLAWEAPYAGTIVSAKLNVNATWSAGNNVGDQYLVNVRRHNNTAADLSKSHDFVTGLAAFTDALMPTGASKALLTSGQNLTITVSTASLTLVSAVDFVVQPTVGDYVSITSVATNAAGATPSNPGVYQITAVNSTKSLTAKKLWGNNPEAVSAVSAGAGDVSDVRLILNAESAFAAGDMLGLRFIVPINTTTPVDVSALKMTMTLRVRPA